MSVYNIKEMEIFHDLVLVQRIDISKSPGGIFMPYHPDRKESNLAVVIAVGKGIPDKPNLTPMVKPDDFVLVARYIGTVFDLDGKSVTMVKWADIQARVSFDHETTVQLKQMGEVSNSDARVVAV